MAVYYKFLAVDTQDRIKESSNIRGITSLQIKSSLGQNMGVARFGNTQVENELKIAKTPSCSSAVYPGCNGFITPEMLNIVR